MKLKLGGLKKFRGGSKKAEFSDPKKFIVYFLQCFLAKKQPLIAIEPKKAELCTKKAEFLPF